MSIMQMTELTHGKSSCTIHSYEFKYFFNQHIIILMNVRNTAFINCLNQQLHHVPCNAFHSGQTQLHVVIPSHTRPIQDFRLFCVTHLLRNSHVPYFIVSRLCLCQGIRYKHKIQSFNKQLQHRYTNYLDCLYQGLKQNLNLR